MNRDRHAVFATAARTLLRVAPERDPARFLAVLVPLDAALRMHARQEEEVLLPVYAPFAAALPPNDAPRVLVRDHDLLRDLLGALAGRAEVRTAADVLARADDLLRFADVLHHHDLREAAGFLPTLEREVPAEVRLAWREWFETEERALPPIPAPSPLPAPPPLRSPLPPLDALRLAAAQDARLLPDGVPVPDHPKGARLHARLVDAVVAARTEDLLARRDALVEVLAAARRLAFVADR